MINPNIQEHLNIIKKGVVEITSEENLIKKIEKSILTGVPLKVKLGLDPTSPDIHVGHTVVLQKLRDFQTLGHTAQIVIGAATAMIGDPSGKSATRKSLSKDEVLKNAETYQEQIFKILIPSQTEIRFNSDWFSNMGLDDFLQLSATTTVARMLERNDFKNRFENQKPISLHEFFYPIMQGYDSVVLESDIELGGTDQTFNLMMGKDLQKHFEKESQVTITMPILEGLDGVLKMSKSLNNFIGIKESPINMFGKIMSIPDNLIVKYFTLLTPLTSQDILAIEERLKNNENPKHLKVELGKLIVTLFHNAESATFAEKDFNEKFSNRKIPENVDVFYVNEESINIIDLLRKLNFIKSNREARNKISEGAVKVNGEKINDIYLDLNCNTPFIIQLGKKQFAKITNKE